MSERTEPYIKYFLDGSRHVYQVDNIAYSGRVYPVVAGQVGVACCRRESGKMRVEKRVNDNILVLPRSCDKAGKDDHHKRYLVMLRDKANENSKLKRLNVRFNEVLSYDTDGSERGTFQDRGIAAVQDYMVHQEKVMVDDLVKADKLSHESYLLKDGSLEYPPMGYGKYKNLFEDERLVNNYRWVVGVSKSFNPELCLDRSKKPNPKAITDLKPLHRTPVALVKFKHIDNAEFAVWYVRIRAVSQTKTPFDGVVKVEKILASAPERREHKISTDTVDNITATIINERHPACYGADARWANHLYPVFLTESYVKSAYISTEAFLNLF